MKSAKRKAIEELIAAQREFMSRVNTEGYEEEDYWMNQESYRVSQAELAETIRTAAHRENWDGYKDTLKADIGDVSEKV